MLPLDLTAFPTLHATASGPVGDARCHEQVLNDLRVPEEVLYVAWAILLKAYTGKDALTFISDDAIVRVDSSDWRVQRVQDHASTIRENSSATGVLFKSGSNTHNLALWLLYDAIKGVGFLRSSGCVPASHLFQVQLQLRQALLKAFNARNEVLPITTGERPELSILNRYPSLLDGPQLLHELVRKPDSAQGYAIEFMRHDGTRSALSYSALHDLSNTWAWRLQHLLAQRGTSQQPIVPVLIPQSLELYVALMAILEAGAAFCPLNLDTPVERVKFIFNDVSATIVLTTSALRKNIPQQEGLEVLCIDEQPEQVCTKVRRDAVEVQSDHLAYIMYTSGSTGTPKGVRISHLAVTQSLLAHDRHIPSFSRFLQFAAPTFDVSVFEIFFPLFRGSTLVSCDRNTMLNDLPAVINDLGIDAVELTPTVAGGLLQRRDNVPTLKLLLTIGEMLTTPVVEEFGGSSRRESMLWGMYGPTECAIHCTLQSAFQSQSHVGNIGIPLDTVSAFVVAPAPTGSVANAEPDVLPVGQMGELAIGGSQLSNGYLNRPDQTAAAFIDSEAYGRLYLTGDKARILPNGTIECLGRIAAGQVKLRGQRIELGEIEQVVLKVRGCRGAIASVISGILVLFCVSEQESVSRELIVTTCQEWLPAFMIPGDVKILQEFPRLPSGKVDKKKLEADYERAKVVDPTVEQDCADDTERQICETAERILGRKIYSSSNLTEVGLNSLLAIRLASLLRQDGIPVGAVDLLTYNSVRQLYSDIKRKIEDQATGSSAINDVFEDLQRLVLHDLATEVNRAEVDDAIACTPLQLSMLTETALHEQAYCNWIEIEFPRGSNAALINDCLHALAAKNEILRSGFIASDSSMHPYVQIVWSKLADEQLVTVERFTYEYQLESQAALLRPLNCQILVSPSNSRALLQIPHYLYDGWSVDLLLSDLNNLIDGSTLEDRPQFRAVVEYYTAINNQDLDNSTAYWQEQLQNYQPSPLPNFNGQTVVGRTVRSDVQPLGTTLADIRTCAASVGCGPQVIVQGAVAYILSSYLGTGDVVFGTVTSGRTIPVTGIERIVGPCIATLPLRVDLSSLSTVSDLLNRIQDLNREMLRHCELPLRDIKRACDGQPGVPLFDTLFVWQETLENHDRKSEAVHVVSSADYLEFNLTLEFEPCADQVMVRATYHSSTLPEAQVQLLFEQVDHVVQFFVRRVDAKLEDVLGCFKLPVLSVANPSPEYQHIDHGLSTPVEEMARRSPDSTAVMFYPSVDKSLAGVQTLTYRELNQRANKLAHLLQARGVLPDDLVCVCMEKSLGLYVSILAVIKSGAGYLPITPDTPRDRIHLILADARVQVCLGQSSASADLNSYKGCLVLQTDTLDLGSYPETDLNIPYRGSDLAYAVFTSGSTGTPKGVLVTQDNLASNLEVLSQAYPSRENSRLLQACSQAFDVSVFEIFFAWHRGICLCTATKDELFRDLEHAIRAMDITHLSLTPTVAALVKPENVPKVQFLVTAGEGVTETVMRLWADKGLYQGYGPSETTNICTLNPQVCSTDMISNIGAPLRNTSAFVFHAGKDCLVPRGAVGELCFGGDQVFQGYLNKPDLTASKIIEHPEYGRLYRSGDLGRLLPDGTILFAGRSDDQVKIRGQRVELEEISRCLLQSSAVCDCLTVVAQLPRAKSQQLITFWVPTGFTCKDFDILPANEGYKKTVADHFELLSSALPNYMVPSSLVPITVVPMTAQGKVDKRKLVSSLGGLTQEYLDAVSQGSDVFEGTQNWSDLEKRTAIVVAGTVGIPVGDIYRHSSFFGLGLDSISAISLSKALEGITGRQLPISTILRNPTVARLSRAIERYLSEDPVTARDKITMINERALFEAQSRLAVIHATYEKILPCTPLQIAMLSTDLDATATYCNRMLFSVTGDFSRLRDCWLAMCERHEVLRTCFVATEDSQQPYVQVVLHEHQPDWEVVEVSSSRRMDDQLAQYTNNAISSKVEQLRPPLAFATVVTESSTQLLFCCHHALYDGAAVAQLLREVEQTYLGNELPPPVSYEPFLKEMSARQSEEADRFWARQLEDFVPTSFPKFRERFVSSPKEPDDRGIFAESLSMTLGDVESQCQKLSSTLLSVAQAAWVKTLVPYLNCADMCFGNVTSGRTLPIKDVERLIAPCFNTVPIRINAACYKRNTDLVKALQTLNIDALPFQLTSLRRIQAICRNDGKRLFDTLFLLQHSTHDLNADIWSLEEDVGEMDIPLVCELVPNRANNTLDLTLHFSRSLLSEEEAQRLCNHFQSALVSCLQRSLAATIESKLLSRIWQTNTQSRTGQNHISDQSTADDGHEWTAGEQTVRDVLSTISGVPSDRISRTTTIYQLGLDSISAVQVAARLRKEGFCVSAADVLERPDTAKLAGFLQSGEGSSMNVSSSFDFASFETKYLDSACKEYAISVGSVEAIRPCTSSQGGMLAEFFASEGRTYLNYQSLKLEGSFDVSTLCRAWETVFRKHPMLRTGFVHVRNSHCPFAMITYKASMVERPYVIRKGSTRHSESIMDWRQSIGQEILEGCHRPVWRVLISESQESLSMHLVILHALYDAHSLSIILDDLAAACRGMPVLSPPAIEPLLGTILSSSNGEDSHKQFWERRTADLQVHRFPNMTPLRTRSFETRTVARECSTLMSELERRCRHANVSMQAVGQVAWAQILSAYTGESTVTFGIVLSGRTQEDAETIPFPSITTVPFACRTDQSNRTSLSQTLDFNAAVQKHQFTPLSRIQHWLGHEGEALFDTIFVYQKSSHVTAQSRPWAVVDEEASANFAASIELEPYPEDKLGIRVTFQADILPAEQAALLLDQFDNILDLLTSRPDEDVEPVLRQPSSLLSITPAKETALSSEVKLLHEFVDRNALIKPDAIALEFATSFRNKKPVSRCWTYHQLDAEGNRIANLLIADGIKPGSLVAICFDKCPEASFAIIGILKAGCAFVAVDRGAPAARKAFIINDSCCKAFLSMQEYSEGLQDQIDVPIINIDDCSLHSLSTAQPHLERSIDPSDLCYCLYTSGTTGVPKGCELTHENAVQSMLAFRGVFDGHWDENSRWLQFASFHFDVSILEQFWSWSVGIRVVSAPRDLIFEDLAAAIRQLEITHIDLTPSLARLLHPDEVPSLCRGAFITGGEQLKQEILDAWGSKGVIYNFYGPTEATIGVTVQPRVPENGKSSNIGCQFANVGSYVLRPNSDIPVIRGGVGELCVSGKLVGKGYLKRPDLTRQRFPHLDRFGERIYRTGDLVRQLYDGSFDFLGRADDQVKLRGQRLEIGEINSVIKREIKGVVDVASLVLTHPKQRKEQLVTFFVYKVNSIPNDDSAYHTGSSDTSDDEERPPRGCSSASGSRHRQVQTLRQPWTSQVVDVIRRACEERLPGYMVPTHLIPLTTIPLSANNKVDAHQLKGLYNSMTLEDIQTLSPKENTSGPRSDLENQIRHTLATMVQVDESTLTSSSSIFEIGLDSISVIGFVRVLRNAGFKNAHASVILRNHTIDRLSKVLTLDGPGQSADDGAVLAAKQEISACQHQYAATVAKALKIGRDRIESIAPCTPLQEGLISKSLGSDNPVYFGSFHFQLSAGTDLTKLRTSWEKVHRNLQVLRTVFVLTANGFVQVALFNSPMSWKERSIVDDSTVYESLDASKREWWERNRGQLTTPFELVVVRSPETTVLALHLFHALYDGYGLPMILSRVQAEYKDGPDINYGPSFHDVLPYGPLRKVAGAEAFWKKHVSAVSAHRMPVLATDPARNDVSVTVQFLDSVRLESRRRELDVTHQALIQACWAAVLQRYLGGVVTFGVVVSGRSIDFEGAEQIIGPLFNTIPFQTGFDHLDTWKSVLRRCHDFNIAAMPFQSTPLRDVMKWCRRSPDKPLFETLFVFQRDTQMTETETKDHLWRALDESFQADYPLALEVEQQFDGTLKLTIVGQGQVLDKYSALDMLEQFHQALSACLQNPDALVSDTVGEIGRLPEGYDIVNGHSSGYANGIHDFEWTPTAYRIRDEIATLIGIDSADIDEHVSIFELGLDSIDAIKLSSRLKNEGVDLSVSLIMRNRTIGRMAQQIAINEPKATAEAEVNLQDIRERLQKEISRTEPSIAELEDVLPVTPLQEAMVAEMIVSNFAHYYNHDILKLSPTVDIELLRRSWQTVVDQSPILRTTFREIDNSDLDTTYAQVVSKPGQLNWHDVQLEGEIIPLDALEELRREAIKTATKENMFRLTMFRTANEAYLVLSIAHALYDGWSLSLLHNDIQAAYYDRYSPRTSYTDVLQDILNASGLEASTFWQDYLSGYASHTFPRGQISNNQSERRVHRKERVSSISVATLKSLCKSQGVTIQTLGQTCWSLVLATYLRTLDVAFGVVLSGRDTQTTIEVLFPTMNTVVVRAVLHGTRTDMLRYMQENLSNIRQHQHFPLRKAQAMAGSRGGALFDTLFIYQKRPDISQQADALYDSVGGASEVEYPVCVEMETIGDSLVWRTASHGTVMNSDATDELIQRLEIVLKEIVQSPSSSTFYLQDGSYSICGLPAFEQETESHSDMGLSDENEDASLTDTASWASIERTIRRVLSYVSKIPEEDISKDMTMFHMGLDSISAIKVSSLLRKESVQLSVSEMLRAATVRRMAQTVESRREDIDESSTQIDKTLSEAMKDLDCAKLLQDGRIGPENVEQIMPATAGQIYFLSVWCNSRGRLFYPQFVYKLQGLVELGTLRRAWTEVVRRNPILRTAFLATGDDELPFIQVVLKSVDDSLLVLNDSDVQAKFRGGASRSAQPMVALSACQQGDDWILSLRIHHALYDGVSLPILLRQLQALCGDFDGPAPTASVFSDFLALGTLETARRDRKTFWVNYLDGFGNARLMQPSAPECPRVELFEPALLSDVRPLELTAREQGLSVQSLFLASYARIYADLTTQSGGSYKSSEPVDVIFGLYLANRSLPIGDLTELAAPTVNLVPLRVRSVKAKSMVETARQIQEDLQDISSPENSAASLCDVDRWTGVKIDSFVNFLKLPDAEDHELEVAGVSIEEMDPRRTEKRKEVVEPSDEPLIEPKELRNNVARDAYMQSVDVEATVKDGALSVGVFSPTGMLDLKAVEQLVADLQRQLTGLSSNG